MKQIQFTIQSFFAYEDPSKQIQVQLTDEQFEQFQQWLLQQTDKNDIQDFEIRDLADDFEWAQIIFDSFDDEIWVWYIEDVLDCGDIDFGVEINPDEFEPIDTSNQSIASQKREWYEDQFDFHEYCCDNGSFPECTLSDWQVEAGGQWQEI